MSPCARHLCYTHHGEHSENVSMAAKIVWTPARSQMGIGTVVMPRPTKPLTLLEYTSHLGARINRMVNRAGPELASILLAQTVEVEEYLSVASRPETAGEVLAENSDVLVAKSGMAAERWPIPPSKIKADPELTPEMVEQEDLEDWLGTLYHGAL